MNKFVLARSAICCILVTVFFVGCADENAGRLELEGEVTYKGSPVSFGNIQFDPDTSKGAKGPQGSADIIDGKFKTTREFGPKSGPHNARVTGYAKKPDSPDVRPLFSNAKVDIDIPAGAKTLSIKVPDNAK